MAPSSDNHIILFIVLKYLLASSHILFEPVIILSLRWLLLLVLLLLLFLLMVLFLFLHLLVILLMLLLLLLLLLWFLLLILLLFLLLITFLFQILLLSLLLSCYFQARLNHRSSRSIQEREHSSAFNAIEVGETKKMFPEQEKKEEEEEKMTYLQYCHVLFVT